jgi:amidohydrolase
MKTPKALASELNAALIEYRRYLHMHPELTNKEYNTSAWIKERLKEINVAVKDGIQGNSIVAYIDSGKPGPCIAFRGDMDALPIEECNIVPYKSTNPGVMHACGHDAHTAILLCLARAFAANRDIIKGKVAFLFQQAEEGGAEQKSW